MWVYCSSRAARVCNPFTAPKGFGGVPGGSGVLQTALQHQLQEVINQPQGELRWDLPRREVISKNKVPDKKKWNQKWMLGFLIKSHPCCDQQGSSTPFASWVSLTFFWRSCGDSSTGGSISAWQDDTSARHQLALTWTGQFWLETKWLTPKS